MSLCLQMYFDMSVFKAVALRMIAIEPVQFYLDSKGVALSTTYCLYRDLRFRFRRAGVGNRSALGIITAFCFIHTAVVIFALFFYAFIGTALWTFIVTRSTWEIIAGR